MKRKDLVPNKCSRCGNDLMTGKSIYHLPYENRYIAFCAICHGGLNLPIVNYIQKAPTDEEWKTFWEEEIDE